MPHTICLPEILQTRGSIRNCNKQLAFSLLAGMALNLTLTALGALSIWLDGQPWLESGAIVVRDGGIYFSNDCSALHSADACRPMKAAPLTTHTGTDPIGSYSEVSVSWSAASTRSTAHAAAAAAALMACCSFLCSSNTCLCEPLPAVLSC